MADIGATLREARIRARIDISEVEARTKIRAKYLRAIENEEWDLLPGPVYVKSFLRTYSEFLGLDSRQLVDEFKRRYERPSDQELRPISARRASASAGRGADPSGQLGAVIVVLAAVAVALYLVGSLSSKNNPTTPTTAPTLATGTHSTTTGSTHATTAPPTHHVHHPRPKPTTVKLKLVPTSAVYVCVEDGSGKKLIDGVTFSPGASIPVEDRAQADDHPWQRRRADEGQRQAGDARGRVADRLRDHAREDHGAVGRSAAHVRMSGAGVHSGAGAPVRAGILVTGTEVLTGIITDRNGPWLSERLVELGVDAAMIQIVGDRPDDLMNALRFMAASGMALVVTSGGLGPTADDLTAEIVGEFAGREMVLDEELEGKIAEILRPLMSRWRDLDPDAVLEANRKQAVVPVGATVLDPVGTAPGLVVPFSDGSGPTVVVLPGPPRELHAMWETAISTPAFRDAIAGAVQYRRGIVRLFGIPESEIANTLRAASEAGVPLDPLEITTCLRRGEIEVATRYEASFADDYRAFVDFLGRAPR